MVTEKRLIDANALIEEYKCLESQGHWVFDLQENIKKIERQPTVDAVEVVHGRWHDFENDPMWQKCSACDYIIQYSYSRDCKYCPNCGAKMDGESRDDGTV